MRLTLTILSLYAFLLQATLGLAMGATPADETASRVAAASFLNFCRHAPTSPSDQSTSRKDTCCTVAGRIGLALPPDGAAEAILFFDARCIKPAPGALASLFPKENVPRRYARGPPILA